MLNYDNLISTIPFPDLLQKCNIKYDSNIFTWNKVLVFNLGFDKKGSETKIVGYIFLILILFSIESDFMIILWEQIKCLYM